MNLNYVYKVLKDDLRRFERFFRNIITDLPADRAGTKGLPLNHTTQDLGHYLLKHQGKHLRSCLLFLSARAAGGRIKKPHLNLASIIELIHNASLLHDDILDEATLRRHQKTFNTQWNNETAVLYGDYLLTQALKLINQLPSFSIRELIVTATCSMCCGELAHTRQKFNLSLKEPEYTDIIRAKTALLFELACHLGSRGNQSRSNSKIIKALTKYGLNFGMAYQIMDDCADLVSDESTLGKTIGRDFSKGLITLPIIRLIQSTPKNKRETLQRFITTNTFPAKKKKIFKLLNQSQSLAHSYARAKDYIKEAQISLAPLNDSPYKHSLLLMAENIIPPVTPLKIN